MSEETLTLVTRYLHTTLFPEVTTTVIGKLIHERKEPLSRKYNIKTSPDLPVRELGHSDWLPGKDAMVTK